MFWAEASGLSKHPNGPILCWTPFPTSRMQTGQRVARIKLAVSHSLHGLLFFLYSPQIPPAPCIRQDRPCLQREKEMNFKNSEKSSCSCWDGITHSLCLPFDFSCSPAEGNIVSQVVLGGANASTCPFPKCPGGLATNGLRARSM